MPAMVLASPPVGGPVARLEDIVGQLIAISPMPSAPSSQEVVSSIPATFVPSAAASPTRDYAPQITSPEVLDEEHLEVRQAAGNDNLGTTLDAETQAGTVTTVWLESTNSLTTTWVQVIYTQTFASVPDQWTTAGSGVIGTTSYTATSLGVKDKSSNSNGRVTPVGAWPTICLGVVGFVAGMGMVLL